MPSSDRQLRAMLRKNWLLKTRHPFATLAEILLPTIVMLSLVAIRTRVDTQIHPAQAYVRKGMFVEVGNSEVSASFDSFLKLLLGRNEHLAFAPDNNQTRKMLDVLSLRYPLLQMVATIYEDESTLETYIRSDLYGIRDYTRLKQHNGELKGGAKASSAGRPWNLACLIQGFKDRSEACSFESKWKSLSRKLSRKKNKDCSTTSLLLQHREAALSKAIATFACSYLHIEWLLKP